MHKIKMIGLDLDGTLLTSDKRLLPFTRQVLTEAIERGIQVLMATGRPYTGIPEELRNLPGMRYALTSNGARILRKRHWKFYGSMIHYKRYTLKDRDMRKQKSWTRSRGTIITPTCGSTSAVHGRPFPAFTN